MKIQPRGKMVLVQPEVEPRLSEIIELPEDTKVKAKARGKVLAVGPDVSKYIKEGDVVFYERFDWTPAPDGGILIKEDEIMARQR